MSNVRTAETGSQLREVEAAYGDNLEGEKSRLDLENTWLGELFSYPIAT